jgi:hypothetical protein
MPRPTVDLEEYRDGIELLFGQSHTQREILGWLAGQGMIISMPTLQRRIQSWGASTRTTTPSTDQILIDSIAHESHTTSANDQTIADRLCAQGIDTTRRQVKRVRLQQGWRRREDDPEQREATRQETKVNSPVLTSCPCPNMDMAGRTSSKLKPSPPWPRANFQPIGT